MFCRAAVKYFTMAKYQLEKFAAKISANDFCTIWLMVVQGTFQTIKTALLWECARAV